MPGRDWAKLAKAVGTKNEKQIKNFFYDWKKGKSRPVSEKKSGRKEKSPKGKRTQNIETEEGSGEVEPVDEQPNRTGDITSGQEGEYSTQLPTIAELRAQAEALE